MAVLFTDAVCIYGAIVLPPDQAVSRVADDPKAATNAVLTPVLDMQNYLPEKPKINLFPPFAEPGHSLEGRSSHPVPPVFPANAERSGRCVYTAQVDSKESVESVLSLKCSDDVFEEPSRASILKTRFHPMKDESGKTVPFETESSTIRFQLLDETGEVIPE